jgi:light-regulated signal transduction histidine kinase (bacteriophytochrome)
LPAVRADRVQMMIQLFHNLIGNALKFCREGNLPNVKIHAEQIGDAYDIYVNDNGIGFDERYLDKIFLPGSEHAEGISLPTHSYVSLCFCFWTALKMIDLY